MDAVKKVGREEEEFNYFQVVMFINTGILIFLWKEAFTYLIMLLDLKHIGH